MRSIVRAPMSDQSIATRTTWFARRRALAAAAALALVGSLVAVTGTAAKSACEVVNDAAPGVSYATLQAAVDAAGPGETLGVRGTCVGNTTINKSLTIEGRPRATLDGNQAGSVIAIDSPTGTDGITLSDLTITHGTAPFDGGGIRNFGSRLTLIDSTVIANSAPRNGGGIDSSHGSVILRDTTVRRNAAGSGGGISNGTNSLDVFGRSSVDHNTASGSGGGISNGDGSVRLHDTSAIEHNAAGGDGGGVVNGVGGNLTLADSSSISGNTAGGDGGGIWSSSLAATLTNCVAGVNVLHNHPDDIFIAP